MSTAAWPFYLTGGGGGGSAATTVVVTITAIPDQITLTTVTLAVAVTVDGAPVVPEALSWKVNGSTTGIADATVTPTTHTPTMPGAYAVTCAATVSGISYWGEAEVYTVGDGSQYFNPITLSIPFIDID